MARRRPRDDGKGAGLEAELRREDAEIGAGRALATHAPRWLREFLEDQSRDHFIHSTVDVNTWQTHPPTVAAARPARCPACGRASRVPGRALGLHGHGVRSRQVRGPQTPDAAPALVVLDLRRYRCTACAAVMTVAPREVVAHRLFAAPAIALALALWGLLGQTARAVRARVSPWRVVGATAAAGWSQLRRWAAAAPDVFARARLAPGHRDRRTAAAVATVLRGFAPVGARDRALATQVALGAVAAV
jgi:hypothetical protein